MNYPASAGFFLFMGQYYLGMAIEKKYWVASIRTSDGRHVFMRDSSLDSLKERLDQYTLAREISIETAIFLEDEGDVVEPSSAKPGRPKKSSI